MNSRERVQTCLDHRNPDRCPIHTSITPEFAVRLGDRLLEVFLRQDLMTTSVGWANAYYQGFDEYTDEWGVAGRRVVYHTKFGDGAYTEIVGHPLAEDSAIESYSAPDPHRPELYHEAEKIVREYGKEHYIVGEVVCTIFETAWALRGLERPLMDFVVNQDLLERLFDITLNYHKVAAQRLVEAAVAMVWLGDEVGSQQAMMISPEMWRRFLKPRMAALISSLKAMKPSVKIAYHSDGVIYPVIPDLIEIGVEVLNPVQPACMDVGRLKKEYGEILCFWGTIDEQHTLPFGTPELVRAEVFERFRSAGEGGGLILGPTHNVQLDTPLENFWAMVEAIHETRYR